MKKRFVVALMAMMMVPATVSAADVNMELNYEAVPEDYEGTSGTAS